MTASACDSCRGAGRYALSNGSATTQRIAQEPSTMTKFTGVSAAALAPVSTAAKLVAEGQRRVEGPTTAITTELGNGEAKSGKNWTP